MHGEAFERTVRTELSEAQPSAGAVLTATEISLPLSSASSAAQQQQQAQQLQLDTISSSAPWHSLILCSDSRSRVNWLTTGGECGIYFSSLFVRCPEQQQLLEWAEHCHLSWLWRVCLRRRSGAISSQRASAEARWRRAPDHHVKYAHCSVSCVGYGSPGICTR